MPETLKAKEGKFLSRLRKKAKWIEDHKVRDGHLYLWKSKASADLYWSAVDNNGNLVSEGGEGYKNRKDLVDGMDKGKCIVDQGWSSVFNKYGKRI